MSSPENSNKNLKNMNYWIFKLKDRGVGEMMTEWLRVAALPEEQSSVSSIHMTAYHHLSLQFQRIPCPLLVSAGAGHLNCVQTSMQGNNHTHKIKTNEIVQTERTLKWASRATEQGPQKIQASRKAMRTWARNFQNKPFPRKLVQISA